MMRLQWLTVMVLLSGFRASCSPHPQKQTWRFSENFSRGIQGWMSFPAPEDIGYDPSIYTERKTSGTFLVRDVIANGQPTLRLGIVRSIHFRMARESKIHMHYRVAVAGPMRTFRLMLAGRTGQRYSTALPGGAGEHSLVLRGVDLRVPLSGEDIEAIALEGIVSHSPCGAHNKLILEALTIDATHPASVRVTSPRLEVPAGDSLPVANLIVRSAHPVLPLRILGPHKHANITLFSGDGRQVYQGSLASSPVNLQDLFSPGLWRAHVADADGSADFRFLVLAEIPPHPRLLLTSERLDQLRTAMPSGALIDLIKKRAVTAASKISLNGAAGDNIREMSKDSLFPGLTPYFSLLDEYGDAISLNALDFRLTGSDESLRRTRAALITAAQWPTWTPPWFPAHGLQSYYEAGIFSQNVALGYDLIADRLSAHDKAEIANALYQKAVLPVVTDYFSNDRMPMADSNHMAHSLGGAIAACMAVYGDVPDWDSRFGPALAKLIAAYEHLLRDMFPGDGSEAEPIDYQEFAMQGLTMAASSLGRAGIFPRGTDRLLNSFWWPYYVQYKRGYELDTGDDLSTLFAHSGFAWAAETSHDAALNFFYQSALERTVASVFNKGGKLPHIPSIFDLACCTTPADPPPALPESRLFGERGSAALRSGWGPDSTLVSIRVGPWMNHGHNDEGSFQVAFNGNVLIGEAGYTSYYSDPRFGDYFAQAAGHNTVLIDANPFSQSGLASSHWKSLGTPPTFTHHLLSDDIDFVEADLKPAYPDYDLIYYRREYLFLKPDLLFVHDSIGSRATHSYTFLLHPGSDIRPIVRGGHALLRSGGTEAAIFASPDSGEWTVASAPIPVTTYRDFDKDAIDPRFVMKLEKRHTRSAEFTVGIQLTRAASPGSLTSSSQNNAESFLAGGTTHVLFRKRAGQLAWSGYTSDGTVLLTTEGDNALVFTSGARQLRYANDAVFTASSPIDGELIQASHADQWQIFCDASTSIHIKGAATIQSAMLDGGIASTGADTHALELRLKPGEHRIELRY